MELDDLMRLGGSTLGLKDLQEPAISETFLPGVLRGSMLLGHEISTSMACEGNAAEAGCGLLV